MPNNDLVLADSSNPQQQFKPDVLDVGGGVRRPRHTLTNTAGDSINPATSNDIASLIPKIQAIVDSITALDSGDASAANQVSIISKIQAVVDAVNVLDSGDASAANQLTAISNQANIIAKLQSLIDGISLLDSNDASAANQLTMITKLQSIVDAINNLDFGDASAANQLTLISKVQAVVDAVTALDANDASAANQLTMISKLQAIADALTSSTGGTGGASASNQLTAISKLQAIVDAVSNGTNVSTPGNPSQDVLTVQGDPNMSPLIVKQSGIVSIIGPSSIVLPVLFTRPSNVVAYPVNSLLANNITPASVSPIIIPLARVNDSTFKIHGLQFKTNDLAAAGKSFRIHLYKNPPTVTNGDGGAFLSTESNWIGSVDITMSQTFSDAVKGVALPSDGADFVCDPFAGTTNIYALIQVLTGFTPTSGSSWTLTSCALRD